MPTNLLLLCPVQERFLIIVRLQATLAKTNFPVIFVYSINFNKVLFTAWLSIGWMKNIHQIQED